MKKIELTQGKTTLVDDEDYEMLSKFKWHAIKQRNTYYASRALLEKQPRPAKIGMHRELMKLELTSNPDKQVDHIDGDGLNNQKLNLRLVTKRGNQQNNHIKKTSRFCGVYWNKASGKWHVQIKINGKVRYIGQFIDENLAAKEYEKFSRVAEISKELYIPCCLK